MADTTRRMADPRVTATFTSRSPPAFAAVYVAVSLVIGVLVSAVLSLPCEGHGFCGELDRSGGYAFLIAGPPTLVLAGFFVAKALQARWILHLCFVAGVLLVLAVSLAGGSYS
jgi:hypothetical protein